MQLTHEQIRLFRHNGYFKIAEGLPAELVGRLKDTIRQSLRDEAEPVVRNQAGRPVRISQVLQREAVFREAASFPPLLDALEGLLGPHIEAVKNRHNHATLNLAAPKDASFHRDLVQWSRGLVSVIFFLEESTTENGCTQIVPGTHLLPGVDHLHHAERADWVEESGVLTQYVPVPMPAGGILLLDGLVFHRIGRNHTADSRMSMTVGYHSADELAAGDAPKRWLVRGERQYMGNDGG